jgi:iron complex transport system ATP-binding protein
VNALLETSALTVRIAGERVCTGLELSIGPGECWALLGRNGVGKTTLLHHLAGLRHDHDGSIRLDGDDIRGLTPRMRARRVALLLQHSDRGFGARVLQTVLTGRHPHLAPLNWEGPSDLAIAQRSLAEMGLTRLADRTIDTLSGGELRRVEIARLLAQQCPISLLDEPLNHLDLAHQATSLGVLAAHCVTAERAMLMAIHDLNVAYHACSHWLLLDGAGRWHAGSRDSLSDPALLSRVYDHTIARIETASGPLFRPDYGPTADRTARPHSAVTGEHAG